MLSNNNKIRVEIQFWKFGLINFFTYFILNNTMIPISLVVSLEFVKVF